MTQVYPQCLDCIHFDRVRTPANTGGPMRCAAFPGGIPQAILLNEVRHCAPYPGDGGIRFEPEDRDTTWKACTEDERRGD